ncbi:MAG: SusD/RagB family nutrient-binding outer membrane lipoprotein [Gemmatimonadota bacterium]|nr:SusD/RagB family nutrient-binding outer membrane lipoprotein [Gemmatimonadota bacterium]
MTNSKRSGIRLGLRALLLITGMSACGNYLTGGEKTIDPNNQSKAKNSQYFVAIQENLWSFWGGDPARIAAIYTQQLHGLANQYGALDASYNEDPNTTNGTHQALYVSGGLIDIKKLQAGAKAANDNFYLGLGQIMEAALMGTGADIFGDLVYSKSMQDIANPPLDNQLTVFDSVQKLLSAGIVNINRGAATDVGPGPADLTFGGDPALWTDVAHTLKARFYMHTAEVRPAAYASALAEAQLGIKSDAGNYVGAFTATPGEQNFYYQFHGPAGRGGDLGAGITLDTLMASRKDPRRMNYFSFTPSGARDWISDVRNNPAYHQPFVTYDENTLIWAEAAYRTGDQATALSKLNEERANHGLPAEAVAGQPLLNEILIEKYIADFQLGEEAWNDYKRTCTPNLVPTVAGGKIPGRLYYDANEQSTNTSIPVPNTGVNGLRNRNDPANATSDGTGAACLAQ